jgi:Holliday junction resolvase RusA-like endonuclease
MPPVAQARHRDKAINGKRIRYNPNKQEKDDHKLLIISALHKERITKPYKGPIALHLWFHIPKPKTGRPIQNGAVSIKRPDLDNYVKFTMDALNGILYEDDAQVCELHCFKKYDDYPSTTISFMEIS